MNYTMGAQENNQTFENRTFPTNTFVDVASVISGMVVIIWTIFANSIIVICFFVNRKKIWPKFMTHILSLCISDMCVGYASLPICLLAMLDVESSYFVCIILFYLFFVSQCASLYHIFGICICRCVIIHRSARIGESRSSLKKALFLAVAAWVVSFTVCSIPHAIYGDPKLEKGLCIIHEIFKGHLQEATRFLFVIYIVPHVLTNILYFAACIRLGCIWRKVFPVQPISFETTTGNGSLRNVGPNQVQSERQFNRSSIRMQRKVLGTIGVLMLIFNICTVPLIYLLKLESSERETKRTLRFIASTLFILNSALNPFVYALRTDWLKLALKKMLRDCIEIMCPC